MGVASTAKDLKLIEIQFNSQNIAHVTGQNNLQAPNEDGMTIASDNNRRTVGYYEI